MTDLNPTALEAAAALAVKKYPSRAEDGGEPFWQTLMKRAAFTAGHVAALEASRPLTPSAIEVRHFAPWGTPVSLCGRVPVGRGEAPESDRFTAKRDDTTCIDCRSRFTGAETGDVREALATAWDEGAGRFMSWSHDRAEALAKNPYRSVTSKGTPETDEGNR